MSYNNISNIFTVDLEEWFHANYEEDIFDNNKNYESRVVENTNRLLYLLDSNNSKATFFVLGYVAEKFPDLILKIYKKGHEIASHGMSHKLVYKLQESEFRKELQDSKKLIKDIIGEEPIGFRAPSWSITDESKWAWKVLDDEGFKYSSSVFPLKNFLYGMPDSPKEKYNPYYNGEKLKLIEVPMSVTNIFGRNIGYSGGAYFRLFPLNLITKKTIFNNNMGNPTIFYIHPREIDIDQPRLKLTFKDKMIHYYGIRFCLNKLERLLKIYKFITIKEYLMI
ncbi:XrtA system polysaccharide deacetylase [Peptoanaerobacter stomatis]|uniref:XrtA system polysaccharide deacetylase n=1 Tax=Peptoanaerobacter stomatis TaxID=796937 RepID=UPI003F9EF521